MARNHPLIHIVPFKIRGKNLMAGKSNFLSPLWFQLFLSGNDLWVREPEHHDHVGYERTLLGDVMPVQLILFSHLPDVGRHCGRTSFQFFLVHPRMWEDTAGAYQSSPVHFFFSHPQREGTPLGNVSQVKSSPFFSVTPGCGRTH